MARVSKSEREEALARLREWVKPGDTVYTILRNVSRSGMSREIGVVLLMEPERRADMDARHGGRTPVDLHPNHAVACVVGARQGKRDGVIVSGCGMDMGFHLVYTLARYLYPDGFGCVGEGCPSNDHSNGDRDYTPHGSIIGYTPAVIVKATKEYKEPKPIKAEHMHRDGGYALRQRWL